jgi:hypothetical protein
MQKKSSLVKCSVSYTQTQDSKLFNLTWTHWALDSRLRTLPAGWDGTYVMMGKLIHWAHTTSHLLSPSWAADGPSGRGYWAAAGTLVLGGTVCQCMRHSPDGMSPRLHGRRSLNMGLDTCMSDSLIHLVGNHVRKGHICIVDSSSGLPTKRSE